MIGCLQTRVCKQPIIPLYFEYENVPKFYNLEAIVLFTDQNVFRLSRADSWTRVW